MKTIDARGLSCPEPVIRTKNALVSGEMDTVCCRPCKPERRQEIADYLNSTPGPDGTCVHVKP